MEIRVLGPLELRHGEAVLALGAPKQKTVLALLLARANTVVPTDDLVDELWDDRPPASARANARLYANNLSRTLASHPDAPTLNRHGDGYLLTVDESDLDLFRFHGAVRRAREHLARAELPAAVTAFDEAIGLRRGPPIADVPAGRVLTGWRTAVEEECLLAVEERAEALLELGAPARVAADARHVLTAEPLRERSHALLIRALYQAGDTAGALVAFDTARRRLDEQLGVEPGEELRQLHKTILDRNALPAARRPAPTPPPQAVVPRQLPTGVAGFAGRADRLRQLDALLSAGGSTTVVISVIAGAGGVGKSALAVHWAHRVADRFPDGQLYVNLRGFDPGGTPMTPAEAVRTFLDAFDVPARRIPAGVDAQAALYRSLLADRRVLVVLDNARDAHQVRPLLPGTPGCLTVVTSRNQLTGLLAAEGAHPVGLDVLTEAEARKLLTRRLGPDRVAAEPAAVQEIISRCARLPLALVIAAARATAHPEFPLATLATELRDAAGGLDAFTGDDAATDVRTVFSWSYLALSDPVARLFRLLGLHPGPDVTASAAASLAGIPPAGVRPLLTELVRANLVSEHAPGRYAFHDLLRAYARELAHTHDDETARRAAVRSLLDHYLHTAHAAGLLLEPHWDAITPQPPHTDPGRADLTGHDEALAWFTAERRNLLAGVETAAAEGFVTHAWQLAVICAIFFQRRGRWHDWENSHRTALAAATRAVDRYGQAHAHRGIANACLRLGRYTDAHEHVQHALDLFRQLGDQVGQAHCNLHLGFLHGRQDRHREALHHAQQALDLYRAANHRHGESGALNNVGWYHTLLGEHAAALVHCRRALRLQQQLGDRRSEATTWDSLGHAHHRLGNHRDAVDAFQRSVALFAEIGDRPLEAEALTRLGDAHHDVGHVDRARTAWRRAVDILHDLGHPDARTVLARLRDLNDNHPA